MFLAFGSYSNMFRPHSRNPHDDNHDPAYSEQVHCSRCVNTTNGLDIAATDREVYPGRKEIVMFFYMYAFIELLAFFMDSGVIPSAHASYPVRDLVILTSRPRLMLNMSFLPLVVRRNIYRARGGDVYLSADQRFCWVPVCRRRNAIVVMGMHPSYR